MTRLADDDPVTLAEACKIAFRDAVTPRTLRAEASRGRLDVFRIGKRDFTTLRSVREMQEKCRVDRQGRGSISTDDARRGLSETAHLSSARAAASATVQELKRLSKNTSGKSTGRPRTMTR